MAQALAGQRFCTLTRYVQLNADSVLVLHIHTLPENEDETGSTLIGPTSVGLPPPYSWLEDKNMQELMVMVHEVVQEKVMKELSSCDSSNKKAVSKTPCHHRDLQLKRGRCLRVLFNFKSYHIRQHVALPTDPVASPLLPMASTFMTDQGRIIFKSSGFTTSGGDFKPFSVLSDSLHVFIDKYDPTSHHGVIKIMMLLDPDRSRSQDVLTYFQPLQKKQSSSSSSSSDGDGESNGVLEDLPVEGLKRRRRGGVATRGRGSSTQGRHRKGSNHRSTSKKGTKAKLTKIHKHKLSLQVRFSSQPTITHSLTAVTAARQATHSAAPQSTRTDIQRSPGIDELFGMDSQWLSGDEEKDDTDKQNVDVSSSSVVNPACNTRDTAMIISTTSKTCLTESNTAICDITTPKVDKSVASPVSSMSPVSCFSVETPSSLLNALVEEKTVKAGTENVDKHTDLGSQVTLHSPGRHTPSSQAPQLSPRQHTPSSQVTLLSPRRHTPSSQVSQHSPGRHTPSSQVTLLSPKRHTPSSQVSPRRHTLSLLSPTGHTPSSQVSPRRHTLSLLSPTGHTPSSQASLLPPGRHTPSSQVTLLSPGRHTPSSQASQLSPRRHTPSSQVSQLSPRRHTPSSQVSQLSPRRHTPSSQVSLNSSGRVNEDKRPNRSLSLRLMKHKQHTLYSEKSLTTEEPVTITHASNMIHLTSDVEEEEEEEEEEDDDDGLPDIVMNTAYKTHCQTAAAPPAGPDQSMDCEEEIKLVEKEEESVKWQGNDKEDEEAGTVMVEKGEKVRVEVGEGEGELDVGEIERETVDVENEQIERMDTLCNSATVLLSDEQDRRKNDDMSPELWTENQDSTPFTASQPLEDITNTTTEMTVTGTGTSSIRVKTPQQALEDCCFKEGTTANTDSVDLTGIIVLSSDDDEDSITTSQQSTSSNYQQQQQQQQEEEEGEHVKNKKKRKRKKRVVNPEILFRGIKEVCDIPVQRVSQWLAQQKQVLVDILLHRKYSRRHDTFITGARNRAALQHQISAHKFNKEQIDLITQSLMRVFCNKNMDYFSYVMSVLYPECLIRLIMDFHSISFEQAERVMMGLDEFSFET